MLKSMELFQERHAECVACQANKTVVEKVHHFCLNMSTKILKLEYYIQIFTFGELMYDLYLELVRLRFDVRF